LKLKNWQFVEFPPLPGIINMQVDVMSFQGFELGDIPPTIRVFAWQKPCISLGYSQKIEEEIDQQKAAQLGWDVVQRPTGGGIVFHNTAEVTYSLVMDKDDPLLPKGLVPAYKKISEAIVWALGEVGIKAELQTSNLKLQNKSQIKNDKSQLCFSYPAEYEVVYRGKKIVGSAQKRGKRALLQQGSIFVRPNPPEVYAILKKEYDCEKAISVEEVLGRPVDFQELSRAIRSGFEKVFNFNF